MDICIGGNAKQQEVVALLLLCLFRLAIEHLIVQNAQNAFIFFDWYAKTILMAGSKAEIL